MDEAVVPAPRPGIGALILGVFAAPRKTMAAVVANPSWLVPLLITAVLSGLSAGLTYKPIIVPMQIAAMEQKSADMPAEQLDKIEEQMTKPVFTYITITMAVIMPVLMTLLAAAILYFLGSLVLGAQSTFRVVFAVIAWTGLIGMVSVIVQTPVRLLRAGSTDAADMQTLMDSLVGLGFLIPPHSGSFGMGMLRGVLSTVEAFMLWQLAVTAEGVAAAFRRPRAFGYTCAGILWAIGAVVAAIFGGMQARA